MSNIPFKRKLYNSIQDGLKFCCYEKIDKKNIYFFSTFRSGSTLLMDLFASQKGYRCISEPLNISKEDVPLKKNSYIFLNGKEEEIFIEYFNKLNDKKIFRISKKNISYFNVFYFNRLVFKINSAPNLLPWFQEHYNGYFMFLVRHPIPTILSRLRNKMVFDINWYLVKHFAFCQKNLDAAQIKWLRYLRSHGTEFEKSICYWMLEHLFLEKYVNDSEVLVLRYEDLVSNPQHSIEKMDRFCNLNQPERMHKELRRPSSSHPLSEKYILDAIKKEKKDVLLMDWQNKVSEKQVAFCNDLLKRFGLEKIIFR